MFTLLLLSVVFSFFVATLLKRRNKLPPGPLPLPLIGNFPQLGWLVLKHGGIVEALKHLKAEYGSIFTIWIGPVPTVHIASMDLAQDTMVKRGGEFVERWFPAIFHSVRDNLGIIGTSGVQWVEQRRFALSTLRNFGLGRGIMEERIMAEVNYRTDNLNKELKGGSLVVNPHQLFDLMVGSIINRMLFGEALDDTDAAGFYKSKKEMEAFTDSLSLFDMIMKQEWSSLPIFKQRWEFLTKPQAKVLKFLENQVDKRIRDISNGKHYINQEEPEDYVDAYILKMKEEDKSGFPTTFSDKALKVNIFDLWIAGQETTVTTLIFSFSYLLNNLTIIEKIRDELQKVTGSNRPLSLKDKPNTPFFVATITEIQRHASILNLNLFRRTTTDTRIGEYVLERGTPVTAQLSLIMSDENYFKNSENFDPTRYLIDKSLEQQVTPFGIGKRVCLGESLARAELYLILGNMILRYNIAPTTELPRTGQTNKIGVLKRPIMYNMKISQI